MNVIFYVITIFQILEMIISYTKTKKIFTIQNVFFVGITLNFLLYLCNWSDLFVVPCQPITYLVIAGCELVVTIFDLIYLKKNTGSKDAEQSTLEFKIKRIRFGKIVINTSNIILLVCLILAMIENIITFGILFPFLNNIDSHKNSISILGTLWKVMYPIGLYCFYFEYKNDKKKNIFEYIIFIITTSYILIGSGGRFWPATSILSFLIFLLINKRKKMKIKNILVLSVFGFILLRLLLLMGMTRIPEDNSYMNLIGYNGPFCNTKFGDVLGWYYGYFPYSFYNLNLTLSNIQTNNLYTYGRFFITPFLYLTKTHKLFNLDYMTLALGVRIITNTSATVATAFFEFYADFGDLFILPMIFYVWCMHGFQSRKTLFSQGAYAYCLVILFFFNFYNVFSSGIPYTFLLLWYLFNKIFVIKKEESNEANYEKK